VPGLGSSPKTVRSGWYATAWFWRPQVALLVSEVTLLPVLMPLAPAATLLQRFGSQLAAVLDAHGTPAEFIDAELQEMDEVRLAKTASRSVVGIMNEFAYLADAWRQDAARTSPIFSPLPCGWPPRPAALCTKGTSAQIANLPLSSPLSLMPSAERSVAFS
jgi:hypothetical protein